MKTNITRFIVSFQRILIVSGRIVIVFLLFLFPNRSTAQLEFPEISYIKLNDKIGIVIDSVENELCKCVSYYDKEEYNYSALIQLPDSNIVLRIILKGELGSRDINMDSIEIKKLYSSALSFTLKPLVNDSINEEEFLRAMSGDTIIYKRIDYNRLKFLTNIKPRRNTICFFNSGIGITSHNTIKFDTKDKLQHMSGGITFGLEIGAIYRNNVFSFRYHYSTDIGIPRPANFIWDFGVLFGRKIDLGRVALSVSTGISKIYFNSYFYTYGLPIQAELFLGANHDSNFSLVAYGNIISKHSFYGLMVCIRFGAVK